MESNNNVQKYAQEYGYKGAKYLGNWKDYKVYKQYYMNYDEVLYVGLPLVILVNKDNEIRFSTPEVAF